MSARAEMMKMLREVKSAGFRVERTGSGHWHVRPPEGPGLVTLSFSPKYFNEKAVSRQLRSIGYER
jgi:hypothetical protein